MCACVRAQQGDEYRQNVEERKNHFADNRQEHIGPQPAEIFQGPILNPIIPEAETCSRFFISNQAAIRLGRDKNQTSRASQRRKTLLKSSSQHQAFCEFD